MDKAQSKPTQGIPTNDILFKKIVASPEHPNITRGFIKDFFGLEVEPEDITIENGYDISEVRKAAATGQTALTTLAATMRDVAIGIKTAHLTIEMQISFESAFSKRAMFYLANAYTKHYHKYAEDPYASLLPVRQMLILNHIQFPDDTIAFRYQSIGFHPDAPELWQGILELPKVVTDPALAAWKRFLLTGEVQPQDPEYLKEAATISERVNLAQEEIMLLDAKEKQEADQRTLNHLAETRGIKLGEARGEARGRIMERLEVAKSFIARGQSPEFVSEVTGIPIKELKGAIG